MKQKLKKIVLVIISFLIIFNFIMPQKAYAEAGGEGIIFEPVRFILSGIADAIMNVSQKLMLPGSPKAIKVRDGVLEPKIYYSPAAIFSNYIPALDVDFINPFIENVFLTDENLETLQDEGYTRKEAENIKEAKDSGDLKKQGNSAAMLNEIIAKWYVALRNVAAVGLLIVLVYLGIRILISATGEEQAKYKKMLASWATALVIVAAIHYIMVFLLTTTEILVDVISTDKVYSMESGDELMKTVRVYVNNEPEVLTRMGYTIVYFVLVLYTLMFTIRYLKRVIFMAFLTFMAPMVALTYPIDKAGDGQAQAFNMWFKEYLFNLLIQPVHLLIYMVLVTSAIELAEENMIYALVAVGFVLQAEKFIKQMFGMQGEGGALDPKFFTGLAVGGILTKLTSGAGKITKLLGNNGSGGNTKIRMQESTRGSDSNAGKGFSTFGSNNQKTIGGGDTKNKQTSPKDSSSTSTQGPGGRRGIGSRLLSGIGASVGQGKRRLKNSAVGNMLPNGSKPSMRKRISGYAKGQMQRFQGTKVGKALRAMSRSPLGRATGNLRSRYINADTAKKAAKLVAMGYGAVAGAAVGIAAGLASDNYENVFKMGALGAGSGAALAKEGMNQGEALVGKGRDAIDTFKQGYHGDQYNDKVLNPKLDKMWQNDADVREYYKTQFGEDWKEKMDEAMEFRRQGITDDTEISKAIKMKDDFNKDNKATPEEAVTAAQMAQIMKYEDVSRSELMNHPEDIKNQVLKETNGDEKTADKIMALLNKRFDT